MFSPSSVLLTLEYEEGQALTCCIKKELFCGIIRTALFGTFKLAINALPITYRILSSFFIIDIIKFRVLV